MYILGRMGNAAQALRLMVESLADIPQAIAFVQAQQDDDLWQLLISLAFGSPSTAGESPLMNCIRDLYSPSRTPREPHRVIHSPANAANTPDPEHPAL